MRKQWLGICIAAGMFAACSSDGGQQQGAVMSQPVVYNGPIVEISGADPRPEPLNPMANQDYQRDGRSYKTAQDPSRFSQAGLAVIYDVEPGSNLIASGEALDPMQLTAARPTLPIPSYARIANLANGRMIVVHINDRGPYDSDHVISLSCAVTDRLNTSNNTKVRIGPIVVAQGGSLLGPGMVCTMVVKQTYIPPARFDLSDGGNMGSIPALSDAGQPQGDICPISSSMLKNDDTIGVPVDSSGFLGAPTMFVAGVLEGSEPTPAPQPTTAAPVTPTTPAVTPAATTASAPAAVANGCYVVQVGAVSKQSCTQQHQKRLSQQFGTPGRVAQSGVVWRVQTGPFASKAEASTLRQRLQAEAQSQSFIAGVQ